MMLNTSWGKHKLKSWLALHILKWLKYFFFDSWVLSPGLKHHTCIELQPESWNLFLKEQYWGVVAHTCNPNIWEVESLYVNLQLYTISHHTAKMLTGDWVTKLGYMPAMECKSTRWMHGHRSKESLLEHKRHCFWGQGASLRRLQTVWTH
jgi:hypothetical protein